MLVAGGVGLFVFLGLWQLFLIRPQTVSLLLFVLLLMVRVYLAAHQDALDELYLAHED